MSIRDAIAPVSDRIARWLAPREAESFEARGDDDAVVGAPTHAVQEEPDASDDVFADFVARLAVADGALVPNLHKHLVRFRSLRVADMATEGRDSPQAVFHRLVDVYADKLARHAAWQDDGGVPAARARLCARECLERWLAVRLYDVVFRALPGEVAADGTLWRRCRLLDGVLTPRHLDLPDACAPDPAAVAWYREHVLALPRRPAEGDVAPGGDAPLPDAPASPCAAVPQASSWMAIAQQLRDWHRFKCPRDKLIAVANACRLLCGVIAVSRASEATAAARTVPGGPMPPATGGRGSDDVLASASPRPPSGSGVSPATADDLLPAVALTLVAMPSPCLQSLIAFCRKYRAEEGLKSELGYYLLNLELAASFLTDLSPAQLSAWTGGEPVWRAVVDRDATEVLDEWHVATAAVAPGAVATAAGLPSPVPGTPTPSLSASPLPRAVSDGSVVSADDRAALTHPPSEPAALPASLRGLSSVAAALVPPVGAMAATQLPEAIEAWLADRCSFTALPPDAPLTASDVAALREEYAHLAASTRALIHLCRTLAAADPHPAAPSTLVSSGAGGGNETLVAPPVITSS